MFGLTRRDLRGGALAGVLGTLFLAGFVWGLAHLDGTQRVARSWHPNGWPASLETRALVGRAGLCLFWNERGELDRAASGVYGEFGRQRELSSAEAHELSRPAARARLDLEGLHAALVDAARANERKGAGSLHELVRPVWPAHGLEGTHVVPRDPWGRGYEFSPEDRERPARLWTLGRDRKPGGEGEDQDLVCEFSGTGEPCFWSGTLVGDGR